jgi:hypothetical protein
MPRVVECPAGQWTTIFNHAFVQLPIEWTVTFHSMDGSPVAGEVSERRSAWIFPQPPIIMALQPQMRFRRGWWNTFYTLRVRPTSALIAQIH